jgi:hypothetical protein
MPSSLVCSQPYKSIAVTDPQFSIKGEEFEAIKYLAVWKNPDQLFAVIEIAWRSISQAYQVHENPIYVNKKEEKIVAITKETINQTYIKLKLMTGGIKQKNSYEVLRLKVRGMFTKWKRVTFLAQFTSCFVDQDEAGTRNQDLSGTSAAGHKSRLDLSQDRTPSYSPILPTQDQSRDLSVSVLGKSNNGRSFAPADNSSLARYSTSFTT